MNTSDSFRTKRHADQVKETAYITRACADYFGSAAHDRDYTLTWTPIAGTIGATSVKNKTVMLAPSLINGLIAPFDGADVDRILRIAAHEAGHVKIAATAKYGNLYSSPLFHSTANIVEDMLIDGPAMARFNKGLGKLTETLRAEYADRDRQSILASWNGPESLDAEALMQKWGLGRLYGIKLPLIPSRAIEYQTIAALDPWGDQIMAPKTAGMHKRDEYLRGVWEVIQNYQPPQPQEAPQKPENGCQPSIPADGEEGQPAPPQQSEPPETPDGADGTGTEPDEPEGDEGEGESESDEEGADADGEDSAEGEGEDGDDGEAGLGSGTDDGQGEADRSENHESPPLHTCPTKEAAETPSDTSHPFWSEVAREIKAQELGEGSGIGQLHKIIDPTVTREIRRALDELAEEPEVTRRHDAGRFDARRIVDAWHGAEDIYNRRDDRNLEGTIALLLDFSGSTTGQNQLIHSTGASIYAALEGSPVQSWIFGYGRKTEIMADPERVYDALGRKGSHGGTPTGPAMMTLLDRVKPSSGSNMIIHVTDGQPDDDYAAQASITRAKREGWTVINVFVGRSWSAPAQYEGATGVNLENYADLGSIVAKAVRSIVQ